MSIVTTILAILKVIALMFSGAMEKDKERKKKLEEAAYEVKEAVRHRDASALTRALDRSRRLR